MKKCILLLFLISITLPGQDENQRIAVNEYLSAGPISVNLPVFNDAKNSKFEIEDLLKYSFTKVADWWPSQNDRIKWRSNEFIEWRAIRNSETIDFKTDTKPGLYYTGFYIDASRWVEAELELRSCQLMKVWLDGEEIGAKTSVEKKTEGDCEPGKFTKTLELEKGKHFILVKTVYDPSSGNGWSISAGVSYNKKFPENILSASINNRRNYNLSDLLDNKKVEGISLSPNGEIAALSMKERNVEKDSYENWIELRKVSDGSPVWTFRGGMEIPEVDWANNSNKFAYTTTSGESKTLWIVDLNRGATEPLLENVKNMGGFEWAPDDTYIVYTVTRKAEDDDPDFKKYELPEDRWPGFRDNQFLYRVFVNSKITERLTAGDETTSLEEISPDSKKILFSKTYYGQPERPYYRTDYFILNLENMSVDSLTSLYYSTGVHWAPDGDRLLFLAGVTTFGKVGLNVEDGVIPNDYDTQAYIYDLKTKNVNPVTKDFYPSIVSADWINAENIYFITKDRSYQYLYRFNVAGNSFEKIDLGVEVVDNKVSDFANDLSVFLFKGSSSNVHEKIYKYDISSGRVDLFLDAEEEDYRDIELGIVKDWDFTSTAGREIKGRIYYPPGFNQNNTYPAIIYYYGGTSPVERSFEGRYPKNYWAANGYVVYVLQPSGATGFGQKFSSKHVNDWGTITAQEIIEGTEKFLEAHKYVNPENLGCIGASYGGFMTMNLITKTDMFSAAISHAGISNLTSYWGVGHWGYWYNSIAAAESFPWNRTDVYVDKSPLFDADKVTTPLLLLHGNADPNVPPGESMQMFVALKHLGKDVTLIEVDKQQHWILEYDKRKKWSKTIIAYFDKYLKDQPEWFESMEY